jgi:tripartite-type tricarboxylate transporter receptor subunit TctC
MALIATAPGRAQNYPARPVHIITPFPAGPTDAVARLFAQRASEEWKQPVVVETRAGATGTIGAEQVVKTVPDGYTLLFTVDVPITMAPALMKLRYDPQADLAALGEVGRSDNVLMVNARGGIHSLSELIAAAKAKPGTLTFASGGNAAPAHLCGEMLKAAAGIDIIHVPYSGAAPAMNALLAGDVTAFCGPIPQGAPHIAAKTAIALGVTGDTESAFLPGVPSLAARYPLWRNPTTGTPDCCARAASGHAAAAPPSSVMKSRRRITRSPRRRLPEWFAGRLGRAPWRS